MDKIKSFNEMDDGLNLKESILKYDNFLSSSSHDKPHYVTPIEMFIEGKRIEHLVDEIDNDDIEDELPVANSYSDAEVGSILPIEQIDDDLLEEIIDRVGEKGVIYAEISHYYWQVRGKHLVRIA